MKIPGARTLMLKRSIVIGGHKTSICLEPPFWAEFKRIANRRDMSLSELAARIDEQRNPEENNLSSATRIFILQNVRRRARVSAIKARVSTKRASSMEIALNELMRTTKKFNERLAEGLAPIAAVIAGSRANG